MLYIGVGLGILSSLGLLALLLDWIVKSEKAEKQQRQQQWRMTALHAAQAKKEAEQVEEQEIQSEYHQLQVNLAALEAEIQMIEASKQSTAQQGIELKKVELLLQKRKLERRLLEAEMQGVTQKRLYDDAQRRIEQLEDQLEILKQGEVGKLMIEQHGEIRDHLQRISREHAVTMDELKKDLEKRFTPAEVENILKKADDVLKEVLTMTTAALAQKQQSSSTSSPGAQVIQISGTNTPKQSGKIAFDPSTGEGICQNCAAVVYMKDKFCHNCGARIKVG